jgi:hypothetical protein
VRASKADLETNGVFAVALEDLLMVVCSTSQGVSVQLIEASVEMARHVTCVHAEPNSEKLKHFALFIQRNYEHKSMMYDY